MLYNKYKKLEMTIKRYDYLNYFTSDSIENLLTNKHKKLQ